MTTMTMILTIPNDLYKDSFRLKVAYQNRYSLMRIPLGMLQPFLKNLASTSCDSYVLQIVDGKPLFTTYMCKNARIVNMCIDIYMQKIDVGIKY